MVHQLCPIKKTGSKPYFSWCVRAVNCPSVVSARPHVVRVPALSCPPLCSVRSPQQPASHPPVRRRAARRGPVACPWTVALRPQQLCPCGRLCGCAAVSAVCPCPLGAASAVPRGCTVVSAHTAERTQPRAAAPHSCPPPASAFTAVRTHSTLSAAL